MMDGAYPSNAMTTELRKISKGVKKVTDKANRILILKRKAFVERTLEPLIEETLRVEKAACDIEESFDSEWSSNPGAYDEDLHNQIKRLRIDRVRLHLVIQKVVDRVSSHDGVLGADRLKPYYCDLVFDEILGVLGLSEGISELAQEAETAYLAGELEEE